MEIKHDIQHETPFKKIAINFLIALFRFASNSSPLLTSATLDQQSTDYLSHDLGFPTMWYVQPAKPLISLSICAVWSEPLLVAWIFYDCLATDWTPFRVSNRKRSLYRSVWVYTCQNATLLEITCQPKAGSLQRPRNYSVRHMAFSWCVNKLGAGVCYNSSFFLSIHTFTPSISLSTSSLL